VRIWTAELALYGLTQLTQMTLGCLR